MCSHIFFKRHASQKCIGVIGKWSAFNAFGKNKVSDGCHGNTAKNSPHPLWVVFEMEGEYDPTYILYHCTNGEGDKHRKQYAKNNLRGFADIDKFIQ